jgi:dihydroorotate dehydrogenase
MDAGKLSRFNKKLYSVVEKLPEYPTIDIMRWFFQHLPIEHMADFEVMDGSLRTVLRGPSHEQNIRLVNPIILAAGYHEPRILRKAAQMGFGAVTAKVSRYPREGNERPIIIRTAYGPENSEGFRNLGMEALYPGLQKIKNDYPAKAIILNISDCSIDNYITVVTYMDPVVDMFELNSCQNSPDSERIDFFVDHQYAEDLFSEVRKTTKKPISLKLPRARDFPEIYSETIPAAMDNGITVLNYGNTLRVKNSRFKSGIGGRSGQWLYPDTLENIYPLSKEFGNYADVIGTGGISSPERAYEILSDGAKAISYMSAFPENILLARQANEFLAMKRSMKS